MRKSFLEAARQWVATLHEDLTRLREETTALRNDVRELTLLVGSMHQELTQLRAELTHMKDDREAVESEEAELRWKM